MCIQHNNNTCCSRPLSCTAYFLAVFLLHGLSKLSTSSPVHQSLSCPCFQVKLGPGPGTSDGNVRTWKESRTSVCHRGSMTAPSILRLQSHGRNMTLWKNTGLWLNEMQHLKPNMYMRMCRSVTKPFVTSYSPEITSKIKVSRVQWVLNWVFYQYSIRH